MIRSNRNSVKKELTKSRPAFDNRQIVNGILWRIRTGAPWRDLAEKHGKWMTVYQRFRRWSEAGIWEGRFHDAPQALFGLL